MTNKERYHDLVSKLLAENKTYQNEIGLFNQFLKNRLLEERVFNLNQSNIDDYFNSSLVDKIGGETTLTTHISALKQLFSYLNSNQINSFNDLFAYISNGDFKQKLSEKLVRSSNKEIINCSLLCSTIQKIDNYIHANIDRKFRLKTEKNNFFGMMISIVFIKLNLLLPLRPTDLLNIDLGSIQLDDVRMITCNNVDLKLPNSLRKQIIQIIEYSQNEYHQTYDAKEPIFYFLFRCIGREASTPYLSKCLTRTYEILGIDELLVRKEGGQKDKFVYPAESYKNTAILNLLNAGTNIVYLAKLTGLDIGTLASYYNFEDEVEKRDVISDDINKGIALTDYYTYI